MATLFQDRVLTSDVLNDMLDINHLIGRKSGRKRITDRMGEFNAVSTEIKRRIIGSKTIRATSVPPTATKQIIKTCFLAVTHKQPIHMNVVWGALKFNDPRRSAGVNLADYLALRRLGTIALSVREVYAPGMVITIILQDACARFMHLTPNDVVTASTEKYRVGLRNILQGMNEYGEGIRIVRESDSLNGEKGFRLDAVENAKLFRDFFRYGISCGKPHQYSKNDSYRELYKFGWRMFPEPKDIPSTLEEGPFQDMSNRMGAQLAVMQHELHKNLVKVRTITGRFVRHPKWADRQTLNHGHVIYKLVDGANYHCPVTPWMGVGVLTPQSNDKWGLDVRSHREYTRLAADGIETTHPYVIGDIHPATIPVSVMSAA